MALQWLTLGFRPPALERTFQQHWALSLLSFDFWLFAIMWVYPPFWMLMEGRKWKAATDPRACTWSGGCAAAAVAHTAAAAAAVIETCSLSSQAVSSSSYLAQVLPLHTLQAIIFGGTAIVGIARTVTLLLVWLQPVWHMRNRSAIMSAHFDINFTVAVFARITRCVWEIPGIQCQWDMLVMDGATMAQFVMLFIPVKSAWPLCCAFWAACTALDQAIHPVTPLHMFIMNFLLQLLLPMGALYLVEHRSRLRFLKSVSSQATVAAAASAAVAQDGSAAGKPCDNGSSKYVADGNAAGAANTAAAVEAAAGQTAAAGELDRLADPAAAACPAAAAGTAMQSPLPAAAAAGESAAANALGAVPVGVGSNSVMACHSPLQAYRSPLQFAVLAVKVEPPPGAVIGAGDFQDVQWRVATALQAALEQGAQSSSNGRGPAEPPVVTNSSAFSGCIQAVIQLACSNSKLQPGQTVEQLVQRALQQLRQDGQLAAALPEGWRVVAVQHAAAAAAAGKGGEAAGSAQLYLAPPVLVSGCGSKLVLLACGRGKCAAPWQQYGGQLRVVVSGGTVDQMLFDSRWPMESLDAGQVQFELFVGQHKQQLQAFTVSLMAGAAAQQTCDTSSSSSGGGNDRGSQARLFSGAAVEVLVGMLDLPVLPAMAAAELQQLQERAIAAGLNPSQAYAGVLAPLLQDLAMVIRVCHSGSSSASAPGERSSSNRDEKRHGVPAVGTAGHQLVRLALCGLATYFGEHRLPACFDVLQQLCELWENPGGKLSD